MIVSVVDARFAGGYRVWLRFDDGREGKIDLFEELWGPVFEPVRDEALFAQVRADRELGTIIWPNGADFAPEFVHEKLGSSAHPARRAS